jgi:hypothetical protein
MVRSEQGDFMRQLATTVLAITSISALATGCIGDDDDGDPSNYIAIADYEQASKDAFCTFYAACGLFPDKASCLGADLYDTLLAGYSPRIVEAVYAGRVRYNGTNVKACLDAIAARSCDRTEQTSRVSIPECFDVLSGTLASGEGCLLDEECISGQCSGNDEESCSMGLCTGDAPPVRTPAAIGQPCSSLNGCVTGAYCDTVTDTCLALEPLGTACTSDAECDYGLGCTGPFGARTCNTLPAIGQSCATDSVCRDVGTYCDSGTQLCTQVGLAGATCTSTIACSQYYPCDFSMGQCNQGPALGESCSSSQRCFSADTYCNPSTSTCTELGQNGETCDSGDQCASGFCSFSTGIAGVCGNPMTCSGTGGTGL